jgi:hypothetical protein
LRAYLRHPSEFPIELFKADEGEPPQIEALENVCEGGLCCHSAQKLDVGAPVRIRIAIGDGFEAKGSIAWCAPDDDGYRVGIAFADHASAFSVRMVQQVCQIERYRNEVKEREGRELDPEDAAQEWIARFAASFPR